MVPGSPQGVFQIRLPAVALRDNCGAESGPSLLPDKPLYDMGMTKGLEEVLGEVGVKYDIFYNVEPDSLLGDGEPGPRFDENL